MLTRRTWWTGLALLMTAPAALRAQVPDTLRPQVQDSIAQRAYESHRAELVKELQDTQNELSELRSQRVQLEANVENALARAMQRRAQMLLMSSEQNALVQLDGMLATAQDNMSAQRDRMRSLGDAVRRHTGAVLVVLLRTDSAFTGSVGGAELKVDGAAAGSRTYSAIAVGALHQGAVDQLYRAPVLPTVHTVAVTITAAGEPLTQTVTVNAQGETVTYVQFLVRGAQIVPSTWTSKGTTPF